MKYTFGALKPKVDIRDYKMRAGVSQFPETYSCENLPPVKNQQEVNSCVAHVTAEILETFNKKETGTFTPLSTDFIYGMQGIAFNRLEGGMYLRDACKIAKEYGDASEQAISGNTEQPKCTQRLKEKLTDEIYKEAKIFKIDSYARLTTTSDLKHALMNYGPVLGSIKWYDEFSLKDKIITFNKKSDYGYHAIMIYGWNEKGWLCQNSWGRHWNGDGKFIFPFIEQFAELWSFVDAENKEVYKPANKHWLKWFYKLINKILNFFK